MLRTPEAFVGRSLGELDLARRELSAVALRRGDKVTVNPANSERLVAGDQLILVGRDAGLGKLS
jgi:uncharacterized protein with PhoU and TrkA domain